LTGFARRWRRPRARGSSTLHSFSI
jgi:hypothetical protein